MLAREGTGEKPLQVTTRTSMEAGEVSVLERRSERRGKRRVWDSEREWERWVVGGCSGGELKRVAFSMKAAWGTLQHGGGA
ncbi:hypothetical protein Syun_013038 [Stephania yunnanensis]|uniref:Uncharacterized protein n=1 Tax=Stephania yunnanensis TaxID=152371 RepID=A0AAP0K0K1_9MAGN